jgi:long-subunit acyl-CoA synthetase (AMP-forming)
MVETKAAPALDLTRLVARLEGREQAGITVFEGGRPVRRSHAALFTDVAEAVAKLRSWGVRPGMRVGIRAGNCYAWVVFDLALIEIRAVSVAFTDDFLNDDPAALCERYALSLMLLGGRRKPDALDQPWIAYFDETNDGVRCMDRGAPDPDPDFANPFLAFSSGSSGGLKGLTLNRRGIEVNVTAFSEALALGPGDRLLVFLPISNFQQRMQYFSALWYGYDFGITDSARLFHALRTLEPTFIIAPPSFWEAFETRFSNLPRWKKRLVALTADSIALLPLQAWRRRVAARLFADAWQTFGRNARVMITGMAPIKNSTLALFRRMQAPLFQTYGLAEAGSVALNVPGANRIGSTGRILPWVDVTFGDDGEIIVRREHAVVSGYFQCAEGENERTFIGGGRVATGDIGRLDADGYLYVTGRKKEVIVTAGGEKLHPETFEAAIDDCEDVMKSVVFGGPAVPYLFAVILPKKPDDPAARRRIEEHVERLGAKRPGRSVGRIIFTDRAFTRENGFLRPNLKLDRRRIAEAFRSEMPALEHSAGGGR